tara:strand:- start:1846 stop:2994 length:1149 start_codon:yes stop_codon:yes gene_type:complete
MDDFKRHSNFKLISAYIDGEVTDEERARIESDPKLMNEVNQILSISKRVGKVVPNDPETKSNHIQTALNEMSVNLPDSVILIGNADKQGSFFARPARILGAVAAAILIIIAIPLFRSGDSSTTQIASENLETSDTEQVVESAPSEVREQSNDGANLEESAPLNSSQGEATIDIEKAGEIATDIDLTEDSETDILEKLEESQNEELSSDEPSTAGVQAVTTPEETFRRGSINTYTSDNPNEYSSFLLQDVRIESGESFDSFVIELAPTSDDPASMIPGPYAIEINGEFLVGEDSFDLPVEINEYVVINLAARGGVWNDDTGYEPSWGSIAQTITTDESNLTAIYFGDFEANLTFVLGIEPNSTFRSYQTMDPPRLIIEVDHNS